MTTSTPSTRTLLERLVLLASGAAVAVGTGPWWGASDAPPSAGLVLIVLGAAFLVSTQGWRRATEILAVAALGIGLLDALGYRLGGAEQAMGPSAYACLVLSATAIFGLGHATGRPRSVQRTLLQVAAFLGVIVVGVASVAILGRLADIESAYRFGGMTPMTLTSALGYGLLGGALFGQAWGDAARRLLPWFVAAVVATMDLYLWQVLVTRERVRSEEAVQAAARTERRLLLQQVDHRLDDLHRTVSQRAVPWTSDLDSGALERFPEVRDWRWRSGAVPISGAVSVSEAPVPWRAVIDPGPEMGVGLQIPAPDSGGEPGHLTLDLDLGALLDITHHPEVTDFSIALHLDGVEVYGTVIPEAEEQPAWAGDVMMELPVRLFGRDFQLQVWPSFEGLSSVRRSSLPEATLAAGLAIAALLGVALHLAQTARHRAWQVARANEDLEQRVEERTAELRQSETRYRHLAEELQRSNTELEQFAYVASHDLQEPLRMVASYTELLSKRYSGQLDAKADKFIGYAVDGAKRMQRLIDDLLDLSRVGTRGRDLEPTPCDPVLDDALSNLQVAIREAGATIERPAPLPTVMADARQLIQLFQNLVGNGIKFRGEAPPTVRVSARREGGMWRFEVTDNGIGIAPEHQDRVFRIFQRLHERSAYEGSGIGLAIARKIVERHGGRMGVESEVGEGTTFHFTLPGVDES